MKSQVISFSRRGIAKAAYTKLKRRFKVTSINLCWYWLGRLVNSSFVALAGRFYYFGMLCAFTFQFISRSYMQQANLHET